MFIDSAELGPTLTVCAILINDNGPQSQADLARKAGVNRHTVSRALRTRVASKYFQVKQSVVPGLGRVNLWQLAV